MATWRDFERLFESPGAPKYCWCMAWRATSEETKRADAKSRKAQMKKRVSDGTPVGILAYEGDEPVAWCSVAPRDTHRKTLAPDDDFDTAKVWSLVCFYVLRRLRRGGVMKKLIAAARQHAKRHGAKRLEAYPVDASSPSYRFGGFVPTFAEAGFEETGRAGSRRHVMSVPLVPVRRLLR